MKHCLLFKVGQAVGLAEHLREFLWHALAVSQTH